MRIYPEKNQSKLSRKQRQYDYIYFFLTYNHVMYCVMSKKGTVATFKKKKMKLYLQTVCQLHKITSVQFFHGAKNTFPEKSQRQNV